jgi:Uncharacterized protein conserved in bacteria (DUF2252)
MVPNGMATNGKLYGWTLARAHARSGDRIAIASYLGNGDSFDRAIVEFSKAYADQNERDSKRRPPPSTPGRSLPRQACDGHLPTHKRTPNGGPGRIGTGNRSKVRVGMLEG